MPVSNSDLLRKYLIKELIYRVEFDNSTHKLLFSHCDSVSSEKLLEYRDKAYAFGVETWKIEELLNGIIKYFPNQERLGEDCYTIDTASYANGTIFYIECRDGDEGDISCFELMKVSKGRMLVLSSDDNGLMPGDIILLDNNRLTRAGHLTALVEGAEEVKGLWYISMSILTIRVKSPSLAHEVIDISERLHIENVGEGSDNEVEIIDISNPLMSILLGRNLNNTDVYMTIDAVNPVNACDNNGRHYEAEGIYKWRVIKNI